MPKVKKKATETESLSPPKKYNDLSKLPKRKLDLFCAEHGIDKSYSKKAKIALLCLKLGVSNCGSAQDQQFLPRNKNLTTSQLDEYKKLTPDVMVSLPGWTKLLSSAPNLNDSKVTQYLLQTDVMPSTYERQYKTYRPCQLLDEVHNIYFHPLQESTTFCLLKGCCNPSQSSDADEVKAMFVVIDKITAEPYGGYCTCTAGLLIQCSSCQRVSLRFKRSMYIRSQSCGHIGSMLYVVAHAIINGKTHLTQDLSCTDKKCYWNAPNRTAAAVAPTPVDNIMVGKQKANGHRGIRRINEDYGKMVLGSATGKEISFDAVISLRQELFAATHHLGAYPPAVHALEPVRFRAVGSSVSSPIVESLPETVMALDSCLAPNVELTVESRPLPPALLPHETVTSVKDHRYNRAKDIFLEKLHYSELDRQRTEELTRGQNTNLEWYKSRWGAVTSSMVYDVNRFMKGNTKINPDRLVRQCMGYSQRYMTVPPRAKKESLKWGITHEESARLAYTKFLTVQHQNFHVMQTGLFVDCNLGYLRASPDGITQCDCHEDRLLEIKCPYSIRDMTVRDGVQLKKIAYLTSNTDGSLTMKKTGSYYDQVQCAMGVCGITFCDFVVWTLKDFCIITVPFDESHWLQLKRSAKNFFETYIAAEILTGRLKGNEKLFSDISDEEDQMFAKATASTSAQSKAPVAVVRCTGCGKLLPEDDYVADDKHDASVVCNCDCDCSKWFCFPCAGYSEELATADWICHFCSFTCASVSEEQCIEEFSQADMWL